MPDQRVKRHNLQMILDGLTPRRRVQLALLLGLSLVGALAELATLGAVLPFLALLADPAGLASYPLTTRVIAWLSVTDGQDLRVTVAALFGLVVLLASIVRLSLTWASVRFTQGVGHDLGVRVYDQMLHQPYAFHVARNTSEVLAAVTKVDAVVRSTLTPALDVCVATILATAIVTALFVIDWVVALSGAGLFATIYGLLMLYSQNRVIRNSRVISHTASARIRALQEGLGGIRDVILDGSQDYHLARFRQLDDAQRLVLIQNRLWGEVPRHVVEALGVWIIAGLAVFASFRADGLAGALPVLGAVAIAAQRLLPLFQRIYSGWNQILGGQGSLEHVHALARAPRLEGSEIVGTPSALPFTTSITLNRVSFHYAPDGPWVLRGIDLQIRRGARIGFAGPTGSGKSTLLDLIMGLLVPTEGQIAIDGVPLTNQNLRHWQARIAHVPQHIFLADTSIAANIAFGEAPDRIDPARVRAAAQRARIDGFIETLDDGYQTVVGERGVRLSGGQRQRVGIARALYRNADVLVLDEATSALDGQTEEAVMERIRAVGDDITVLIVAHRLATLEGCDTVLSLNQGGIVSIPPAIHDAI